MMELFRDSAGLLFTSEFLMLAAVNGLVGGKLFHVFWKRMKARPDGFRRSVKLALMGSFLFMPSPWGLGHGGGLLPSPASLLLMSLPSMEYLPYMLIFAAFTTAMGFFIVFPLLEIFRLFIRP